MISRKGFLTSFIGGGFTLLSGSVLYPLVKFLVPPEIAESTSNSVVVGKVTDFKYDSGQIFKFGNKPGILIRTVDGDFKAFSAICTHLNCIVQYNKDEKHIWCACHNGHFDLKGNNIAGPPPRPLEEFKVDILNDEVIVSKNNS